MFFARFMLADLGKNSLEVWKDEVLDQSIEVNNLVYKVPFIFRYGHFVLLIAYSNITTIYWVW